MRPIYFIFLVNFPFSWISGQSCPTPLQSHIWYFGDSTGLDFATIPPSIVSSKMETYEASSIVCDTAGQLLFYSNGELVFNRNHQIMPGVNPSLGNSKLNGSESATQILALPLPGSNHIYYLFYMETFDFVQGTPADTLRKFLYAIIDMNQNGGLGDVVSKNNVIFSKTTEKVAAVRHCNGADWWIVTLESGSNRFMAWMLSNSGVSNIPVTSSTGKISSPFVAGKGGAIKLSPDGSKLAKLTAPRKTFNGPTLDASFEIFKFDNATGIISSPLLIWDSTRNFYGGEFSPDGTKFYANAWTPFDTMYQFDLCIWNRDSIWKSKTILGKSADNTGNMLLAPDGKIYIACAFRKYLSTIEHPNAKGLACLYKPQSIQLPNQSLLGLPNFPASYYAPRRPYIDRIDRCTPFCKDTVLRYHVVGDCNGGSSFQWSLTGGTILQQNRDTVWIKWQQPGSNFLSVQRTTPCGVAGGDTIWVTVNACQQCIPTVSNLEFSICSGDTLLFHGNPIASGQSVTFHQPNAAGCDSTIFVNVKALPSSLPVNIHLEACQGDSAAFQNTYIPAGQSKTFHFVNFAGCDSSIVVSVAALPPSAPVNIHLQACQGDSAAFKNTYIPAGQSKTFHLVNFAGCDSSIVVSVAALPSSSPVNIHLQACQGDSAAFHNTYIPAGQSKTFHLVNFAGCDSSIVVSVAALPVSSPVNLHLQACQGDSAAFQNTYIPAGQSKTFHLVNFAGCDSSIVVSVAALPVSSPVNLHLQACQGDSAAFQNTYIPAGQSKIFHLNNFKGCDSTVIVTVKALLASPLSSIAFSACNTDSVAYQNTYISAGQSKTFHFINFEGCDSTVIVSVKAVIPPSPVNIQLSACQGDSAAFQNTFIPAGQSKTFHLTSYEGCDSTLIVQVKALLSSSPVQINLQACQGDSIGFQNTYIPAGQSKTFHFINFAGCDSTVVVLVKVLIPPSLVNIQLSACQGDSAAFQNTFIPAGQSKVFHLTSYNGCDSMLIVQVKALLSSGPVQIKLQACQGDSVAFQNTFIQAGQSKTFHFMNYQGCDSSLIVTVQPLLPSQPLNIQLSACQGDSAAFQNTYIPAGQSRTFHFINYQGCDSSLIVTVQPLFPSQPLNIQLSACQGDSVAFQNTYIPAGQSKTFHLVNYQGCDSTLLVHVKEALPSLPVHFQKSVCPGDSVVFQNTFIPAGESKSFHLTNFEGCDSTLIIEASQWPPFQLILSTLPSCPNASTGSVFLQSLTGGTSPFSFSLDANTWKDSLHFEGLQEGIYAIRIQDAHGCSRVEKAAVAGIDPLEVELSASEILPCDSLRIALNPVISGDTTGIRYKWSDGSTGPALSVGQPGAYTLRVRNRCQEVVKTTEVSQSNGLTNAGMIYVPNTFAPESVDPQNNRFRPMFGPEVTVLSYRLEIFDRWGSLVFRTADQQQAWDGYVKSQLLTPQVLVWRMDAVISWCGRTIDFHRSGDVSIVR
jgi:hypothetical protein